MEFQYKIPIWENEGQQPPEELLEKGFTAGYKPPASFFNWFWNLVTHGVGELQDVCQDLETRMQQEHLEISQQLEQKMDITDFTGEKIGELLNDAGWIDGFHAATKEECEAYLQEVLSLRESASQTLALAQQTIAAANEAKQAVVDLKNQIAQNTSKITVLWDAVFTDIITNPFQITFENLDGVALSSGVWNETLQRVEC